MVITQKTNCVNRVTLIKITYNKNGVAQNRTQSPRRLYQYMNVIFKDKNVNNSIKNNQKLILIETNRDKFKIPIQLFTHLL